MASERPRVKVAIRVFAAAFEIPSATLRRVVDAVTMSLALARAICVK